MKSILISLFVSVGLICYYAVHKSLTFIDEKPVICANETAICNLPEGKVCTISYGADLRWSNKSGLFGSIDCSNNVFGDPAYGTVKSCIYSDCSPSKKCSNENSVCELPEGQECIVTYGGKSGYSTRKAIGAINCNNIIFGDPEYGTFKHCIYSNCKFANLLGTFCSKQGENCIIPEGKICSVKFGVDGNWISKSNINGFVGCNNEVFSDYEINDADSQCFYSDCFEGSAIENQKLTLPVDKQCTISYGVNDSWFTKKYVQGSIDCKNNVFGDPAFGIVKSCKIVNCTELDIECAKEWGVCSLPEGLKCSVRYGEDARWTVKSDLNGSVSCTNQIFGDPAYGTIKRCHYFDCDKN